MSEADSIPVPEEEPVTPKSFFARLGGVYASPGAAFEEIGQAPRVLVPIFILIAIGAIAGILLVQFIDRDAMVAGMMQQVAQRGGDTAQMQQVMPLMSVIVIVQVVVGLMLGGLINGLAVAGYGKLFSAITGAKNRFKALFSVTLYAFIAISVIKYILLVLVVYLKRPFHANLATLNFAVASNLNGVLSGLLGEDVLPKYLKALTSYIDFFTIWLIVLLAIGFSVVSKKLKTGTAAAWLGGGFGIFILISAIFLAQQI